MGRVIQTFPDQKGFVRQVRIKARAAAWTGLSWRFACCRRLKQFEDILASVVTFLTFFFWTVTNLTLLDFDCLTLTSDTVDLWVILIWFKKKEELSVDYWWTLIVELYCWKSFYMFMSPSWYVIVKINFIFRGCCCRSHTLLCWWLCGFWFDWSGCYSDMWGLGHIVKGSRLH